MEVFIAYTLESSLADLGATLDLWEKAGLEPVAIECKKKKFEMIRRVTAENISRADYILASVGSAPVEEDFAELAQKALDENKTAGLITIGCIDPDWVSGRVAICRKGVITHWIQPKGSQEADVLYASAHAQAYRHAGYEAIECHQIHYRRTNKSLPC